MKIYILKVGNEIFEYQYLCNTISLITMNKLLASIDSNIPLLNNNDVSILSSGGGTIIYNDRYLIDLDFVFDDNKYKVYDNYLYDKFENYRKSIKRDMKLNNIIE